MQHYQFHIGDYTTATVHLTPMEDLAYRRLLDLYYSTEGHLPAEVSAIARRIRLDVEPVEQVLSEFFFQDEGGEWKHHRCDQELEKMYEKSDKARANAAASHAVRRAKANASNSGRIADALQTQSERNTDALLPVTRNPLPIESTTLSGKPDPDQPEKKKLSTACGEVLTFLNEKTGRNYRPVKANIEMIAARLKEGATVDECRQVIAKKCREWRADEKMESFLRPKTLFNRTNFAQYQGELTA